MKYGLLLICLVLISCAKENEIEIQVENDEMEIDSTEIEEETEIDIDNCDFDDLYGNYFYRSDEQESPITILVREDTLYDFSTGGLLGLWFPAASLSGNFNDCDIVLKDYENVKIQGLPTQGGGSRYYYDSMSGFGNYIPESDSIILYIDFLRTGDFGTEEFKGNVYLKKVE